MKVKNNFSVVVLAAGYSARMGTFKAFLPFNDKQNFIEKIINEYKSCGIGDIVVVVNSDLLEMYKHKKYTFFNQCRITENHFPEKERFFSIQLGLSIISGKSEFVMIQNCDNPFIDGEIITEISDNITGYDAVMPMYGQRGGHPVMINKELVNRISQLPSNQNLKDVLTGSNTFKLKLQRKEILYNINTLKDYESIFKFTPKI